jgi:hypothetical protein
VYSLREQLIFSLGKRFEESGKNWHITSLGGGGGAVFKTPYHSVLAGCWIQVTPP